MSKIIGIYKITSPSKRVYIGQSADCEYRKNQYSKNRCKNQPKIHASINKYGWDRHTFEIIHICEQHELNDLEIYYIATFKSFNSDCGLNLKSGGIGGKMSDETKIKIGIKSRRSHSSEHRRKQSEAISGLKNGMYGNGYKLQGEKNGRYGKKCSNKTLEKIGYKSKLSWEKRKKNINEVIESSKRNYDHKAIIELHNQGYSYSQIMKKTAVKSISTVSFIINKSLTSKINE